MIRRAALAILVRLGLASPGTDLLDRALHHYRLFGPAATLRVAWTYLRAQWSTPASRSYEPFPPDRPRLLSTHRYRVLYLVGTEVGGSRRYRVDNYREYLEAREVATGVCGEIDCERRPEWMLAHDVIVVMRAPMTSALRRVLTSAKERGVLTVFDTDDLIFDPSVADNLDALKDWQRELVAEHRAGAGRYREALEACDYFTAPTEYLAQRARALGKTAFVLPNGFNGEQQRLSEEGRRGANSTGRVVVGYFSGTATHDADFRVTAPALARVMR
ncbi:MAG: hypothetical protein GEU28_10240, partial [Dehalococcoidia bacterium]|nr:hypothetical protein [Dehalococcoidia bacterium]